MARLNIELQKALEPIRIAHAKKVIETLGYVICHQDETRLQFMYRGKIVTLYPYSGWHTGATIKDGRGLKKLTNQIKQK